MTGGDYTHRQWRGIAGRLKAAAEEYEIAAVHAGAGLLAETGPFIETDVAGIGRGDDVHALGAGLCRILGEGVDQRRADTAAAVRGRQIDMQVGGKLPGGGGEVIKAARLVDRTDEIAGNGPVGCKRDESPLRIPGQIASEPALAEDGARFIAGKCLGVARLEENRVELLDKRCRLVDIRPAPHGD